MDRWVARFDLKESQADAVTASGRDVSVSAGAGSGKTRTLVARCLRLLDEGRPARALAAVTFTEKAAREMRNRLRAEVHAWRTGNDCPEAERARWAEIEADIDAARIGTIHGLCAALLRAHPAEAEVDPEFEVLDEGLAAALRAQVVEDALAWAVQQADLEPLFLAFSEQALTDLLSQALESRLEAAPWLAEADPARGWNRGLLQAVLDFANWPEIAAPLGELRRLAGSPQSLEADAGPKLGPQVMGLLAEWEAMEQALRRGQGLEAARRLFAVRRPYCVGGAGKAGVAKQAVKALREAYDAQVQPWLGGAEAKDPPPDPELEARAASLMPLLARLFTRALEVYQAARDARLALDFDDLEAGALRLLSRPEVRARWQAQIDLLLVDEFQDTNARQRQIVEALAGERPGRLFVVGDAKQSIYRFRGADVTVFRALDRAIRARGGQALELGLTFRAHAPLLALLNPILRTIMGQADDPDRPYQVPFAELQAQRAEPRAGMEAPYLEFVCGTGADTAQARPAAARQLARRLRQLHETGQLHWDDVALLFRASTGFPAYEAALEVAGIPFVTVAGRGFYDRPEVRDLLNILRALADPWDDLALAGLLRSPAFGLSDDALYRLRWPDAADEPVSFRQALSGSLEGLEAEDRARAQRARETLARLETRVDRVPVSELLKQVLDETLYLALLEGAEQGARLRRNVDKLLQDAHESGLVRVREFLEYLQTLQAAGAREGEAPAEAEGAVRLMTVHKAKGLEFPVVVLADAARRPSRSTDALQLSPGLGAAACPDRWGEPLAFRLARVHAAEQEMAEEQRLLYVALTRAREKLIVSGHLTERAAQGWLGQLATAGRVDLAQAAGQPQVWQFHELEEQTIGVLAGTDQASPPLAPVAGSAPEAASVQAVPLFQPLPGAAEEGTPEETVRRMHRVTWRGERTDGTTVGVLVHAALARWAFPGDERLQPLLNARALDLGLVDPDDRHTALGTARMLLERLRRDPRWTEMDAAARRHEVPYGLPDGATGVIDLLFRRADRTWVVVDLKTDALADEGAMRQKVAEEYGHQLGRYRAAVEGLLGGTAVAEICFLDVAGQVRWERVD